MKNFILPVACFLFAFHATAQSFGTEKWNNVLSNINGQEVVLSFFIFPNQEIKGEYFYQEKGLKKPVAGFFRDGEIQLFGTDSTAFKLVVDYERTGYDPAGIYNPLPRFAGSYTNGQTRTTVSAAYFLSNVSPGTFRERYPTYHLPPAEIEAFAANIVKAFLRGDKEWIADHCRFGRPIGYDLSANTDAGTSTNIRTRAQFLKLYPFIATADFKEGIKAVRTQNLSYSRDRVIVLGGGYRNTDYVYIYDYFDSSAKKYRLFIGALEGSY